MSLPSVNYDNSLAKSAFKLQYVRDEMMDEMIVKIA